MLYFSLFFFLRCISLFFFFFFALPVVFKAVKMCQGLLDFYSGAVPQETGKCLSQQAVIDEYVLNFWRFLERGS